MINLDKLADVLEKTAAYLDEIEESREREIRESREKLAGILTEKYQEVTGDTIDPEVLNKIADSDLDVLGMLDKLTEGAGQLKQAELGSPSDRNDYSAPMTKKEAAAAADEQFLSWIMGS